MAYPLVFCGSYMNLADGFQIEQPQVFVPWSVSEAQFVQGFGGLTLRRVTDGYFTAPCISLNGLSHKLGFYFYPPGEGRLVELEFFFPNADPDLPESYQEFQRHLETTFGQPTVTKEGPVGFPSHLWRFPGADVIHLVRERFGLEEHVRIQRRPGVILDRKLPAFD